MRLFLTFLLLMYTSFGIAQQLNKGNNAHYIKHMKEPSDIVTKGSGPLSQQSMSLSGEVTSVQVMHGIRYEISNSNVGNFITIVAEKNIMPFVQVGHDGGTLSFSLNGSIESNEGIKVIMNNKNLEKLLVKDGAEGEVLLTESEDISITVMGGSDMTIKGSADKLDLFVKGGSHFEGRKFHVSNGIVGVKGASETTLSVSETLKAHSENGSVLVYFGDPEITSITKKLDGKVFHREAD